MATTPQNRNLLQLDELDQAYESAQLYVVHSGQDYRISLETLLSLITKARLGIENVDNTKDIDKPVSNPTQQAITEAISDLVGRAEFDALMQSIQTSVDQETLDAAIANINLTLNSKLNQDQTLALISQALMPVNQGLVLLGEALNGALTRIASLESRVSVTQAQLDAAIAAVNQATDLKLANISQTLSSSIQVLSQSIDSRILLLTQSMNSLSIALENKADRTHLHLVTHIEDFELEVRRIAAEYVGDTTGLNIGPNDW